MSDNLAMALRWLAKIMPHKPVYVVQKRVLRDAADYIDGLEARQVLLEGLIELLIEDGDRAVYMRGMRYNKAWREAKALAVAAAPDGDYYLPLTPGMRVYRGPLAREYDDPTPVAVVLQEIREEDRLRADVVDATVITGLPVGVNAYGEEQRTYSEKDKWPFGDAACQVPPT